MYAFSNYYYLEFVKNLLLFVSFKSGKKVLISAHGNSLRGLIKYLDNIADADIVGLNIPTGERINLTEVHCNLLTASSFGKRILC